MQSCSVARNGWKRGMPRKWWGWSWGWLGYIISFMEFLLLESQPVEQTVCNCSGHSASCKHMPYTRARSGTSLYVFVNIWRMGCQARELDNINDTSYISYLQRALLHFHILLQINFSGIILQMKLKPNQPILPLADLLLEDTQQHDFYSSKVKHISA